MDLNQTELLNAAMNGDETALQLLLLSCYDVLASHVRNRLPATIQGTIGVEDVLQVTFIQVFRGFTTFRPVGENSFLNWVRSIADARLTDFVRTAQRRKRGGDWERLKGADSESLLGLLGELSGQAVTPSRSAAAHEAVEALRTSISELDPDQKKAIELRYLVHLSVAEVAERMGRSEAAVRGLLHRGKQVLRESLGNSSLWFSQIRK